MNFLRKLLHREPTPAERLQALVDAARNSHETTEFRLRRAAAKLGHRRRKDRV